MQTLFETFKLEMLEGGGNKKIGKRVFTDTIAKVYPNMNTKRVMKEGIRETVYCDIRLRDLQAYTTTNTPLTIESMKEFLPHECNIKKQTSTSITCEISSGCVVNGLEMNKSITFFHDKTWKLEVAGKEVNLADVNISKHYEQSDHGIKLVCKSVKLLSLCHGESVSKSVSVSRYHTVEMFKEYDDKPSRKIRSLLCNKVIPFTTLGNVCRKCQQMTYTTPDKNLSSQVDIESPSHDKENIAPQVSPNRSTTRQDIMKLFPGASDEMVDLLLNQAKNCNVEPKGRRWDQSVISACLKWFMRSPQSYNDFRESKFLLLPSPSSLILYKNRIKQNVGFDDEVFRWMFMEAQRRQLPACGWSGGIILDEMSIQADIQISKTGDMVELSGLVEMGGEGNTCHILRTGNCDKIVGTHVLQMVFLGVSGFRFPVAHFITDGIQAPELYTLFWDAVNKLQRFGFTVLYTCMDGAQCNRSFMRYCIGNTTTFMCQNLTRMDNMIFMMDVSHVIKKIRNNVMKSGVQKTSTRLLTLSSGNTVQWQMFIDCFKWDKGNALQLHRRLTNEHLFPSTSSKMRNHLAEDVLSSEMLNLMRQYQTSLGKSGDHLNGVIEFLQVTSALVNIFRSFKPIRSIDDERLTQLLELNNWFTLWEETNTKNSKALMSQQCHEDLHACIVGFRSLCHRLLSEHSELYVMPALVNSDVVENTFNQVRSTYNGASSNPNALQYRRTLNSIVLGQKTISQKGNAGKSTRDGAMLYSRTMERPVKRKVTSSREGTQKIKIIRC